MRCPRRSTNRSKDRRQLLRRFDYLATFHRYATSFTTASSLPPPLPPPPSSEALWQRSSLGRYRFPPIALSNSIASGTNPKVSLETYAISEINDPHEFAYREISWCACDGPDLSGLFRIQKNVSASFRHRKERSRRSRCVNPKSVSCDAPEMAGARRRLTISLAC